MATRPPRLLINLKHYRKPIFCLFLCRQTRSSRVLPLLILVPAPSLPLLHPRHALFSLVTVLIPLIAPVIGRGVRRGATHCIDLALTLALDRTDGVVDDLLRRSDAAVNFMVPNGLDLEALALKFVPVEERHGRLVSLAKMNMGGRMKNGINNI